MINHRYIYTVELRLTVTVGTGAITVNGNFAKKNVYIHIHTFFIFFTCVYFKNNTYKKNVHITNYFYTLDSYCVGHHDEFITIV